MVTPAVSRSPLEDARRLRVVIIGFGPVGARLCEELLPAVETGDIELTVIGAEKDAPYNRVLVAEMAVDRTDIHSMTLHEPAASIEAGARVCLDTRVTAINRTSNQVELSTGEMVSYDRLVLATGARASIPRLGGIDRPAFDLVSLSRAGSSAIGADPVLPTGITVLRDLTDAARIRAAVRERARIVVLGAGVLGLEFALLAAESGADVSVVHHGPTPMPRSLDRGSGTVLARALRARHVTVYPHSAAEDVEFRSTGDGTRTFDGLITADGNYVRGDLLVLSCGVGARAELATTSGMRTASGIVVDAHLRSWTDDNIFAIGDCAHIVTHSADIDEVAHLPGAPSGLIGPGWRQAEWLGRRLTAEASGLTLPAPAPIEPDAVVMLKSEDIDVVAVGDVEVDVWDSPPLDEPAPHRHVAQWADPQHGRYLKLVTRDGILEAFASVGMPRTAAELTLLYNRRSELPADRSLLLRLDGAGESAIVSGDSFAPTTTACLCNGVTVQHIEDSVTAGNGTVACVGRDTRAGTGCGGCKPRLAELIERFTSTESASAPA